MAERDDPMVTLAHMRAANFCVSGAKNWCAANGLDFNQLMRAGGIPASRLEATGDALGIKLAAIAKQQAGSV